MAAGTVAALARTTEQVRVHQDSIEDSMRNLAIKLLALTMLVSAPVFVSAQQADEGARGAQQTTDRDDDGNWGWLGLLGLVGLMGLKRRDRDHVDTRDRVTAR
jgi:MYXO-CTERM domain-containing protein